MQHLLNGFWQQQKKKHLLHAQQTNNRPNSFFHIHRLGSHLNTDLGMVCKLVSMYRSVHEYIKVHELQNAYKWFYIIYIVMYIFKNTVEPLDNE